MEDVERRPLFLQIKLFCYNILIIKKYFIFLNDYFISFLLVLNNIVKIYSYYTTKKLKQMNIDNASISKAVGLTIDEINKL